ncbi:class I adenylate-forming enzyme family protein [Desulfatibacillum aliphaticivorans]|uniref:class I adenylate-forming enzyme family protein n=1 Tax=Desulfatibacillum aliphaticivorans TaxID=218208 RepID=UPI0004010FAF|nr:long-chain-fatty-acid--CoA ligase [Desulfatibacillum aliphaticivorans]
MQTNLGHILANRAFLSPSLEACVGADYRYTYAQENARANRFASALKANDFKKGDRIAVLCKNNEHIICALMGAAKMGVVAAILNWRLTAPELEYILNNCGADMLIYDDAFAPVVDELKGNIPTRLFVSKFAKGKDPDFEDFLAQGSEEEPSIKAGGDDPCVIMYTSGTTGKPKGAMISHNNAFWASLGLTHTLPWAYKERYLLVAPLFHIGGLSPVFANIHKGLTTVFMPDFDPVGMYRTIQDERINFMMTVPLMLMAMAMVPPDVVEKFDLSSLNFFVCGASPVPPSLIHLYNEKGFKIAQVYGATEYTGAITFWTHEIGMDKCASAGKPVFHGQVKVCKPGSDEEVPAGEVGELCLFGPQVFLGYWNNPKASEEALTGGCYRSGDLGRIDEDGCVYVIDRLKDMIISGGENIYPAEIEQVLQSHPAVAEAAVTGRPDEKWGEIPVAHVAVRPGETITEEDILQVCRDNLAGFKRVKEVHFVEALPKNSTGKILKTVLREELAK